MIGCQLLYLLTALGTLKLSIGTHFLGGTINWRPLNRIPVNGTVQVLVRQRYGWRSSNFPTFCTSTTIMTQGLIGGSGMLQCLAGAFCVNFNATSTDSSCTDFNTILDWMAGERLDIQTLSLGAWFLISFTDFSFAQLAIAGNGIWFLTSRIDLTVRPDGKINTSPSTQILPVIRRMVNTTHTFTIPMLDDDRTDILRCRWSTNGTINNTNGFDECASVCAPTLPPGYILFDNNCTLVFMITMMASYVVSIQIEDYFSSTAITPMSSTPVQFLIYGISPPSGCSTKPSIIGQRPNQACIGIQIGVLLNQTLRAQANCPNKTIIDFDTASPVGLIRSSIFNTSSSVYMIMLNWVPTANQSGPQSFCAIAVDDTDIESESWCVTFVVGTLAPSLQSPNLNSNFGFPTGTIQANHSYFFLRSGNGLMVHRPRRRGVSIHFNDATINNARIFSIDCFSASNVNYSNDTMTINIQYAWISGHSYYITLDSGVLTGDEFCGVESEPIISSTFWTFHVANPFTTTTTTTSLPTISTGSFHPATGVIGSTTPDQKQIKETIAIVSSVIPATIIVIVVLAALANFLCKCCQHKIPTSKTRKNFKRKSISQQNLKSNDTAL